MKDAVDDDFVKALPKVEVSCFPNSVPSARVNIPKNDDCVRAIASRHRLDGLHLP